jgi:hypothetical protein
MLIETLNDVREGHYFLMRKYNSEVDSEIMNFGLLFLTLLVYYAGSCLLIYGIIYEFTEPMVEIDEISIGFPVLFLLYLIIYYALIYPKIKKGRICEEIPETDKKKKIKLAKTYGICCIFWLPLVGVVSYLIFQLG